MAAEKVVLVFGGSGTIGSGIIKALLKSGKVPRIVSVARTSEKLAAMKDKFGNLPEDKLLIVEGNVASEENAAKLRDDILAKTGKITDVVSCMGSWWQKGPLLDQPLSEFKEVCDSLLGCHFIAAKTFLPLIGDNDGSSYTFITGSENYLYVPNIGLLSIFAAGLVRMIHFIMQEWEQKSVRINAIHINVLVQDPLNTLPYSDPNSPAIDHEVAGRGVSGVVLIPSARGKKLPIYSEADFVKLAKTGTL